MLNKKNVFYSQMCLLPPIKTFLIEDDVLVSPTEGDPGLVSGCGHQLRSDLHHRVLQPVQLQLPHQRAEQHGCHGVGEPSAETGRTSGPLQDAGETRRARAHLSSGHV